MDSVQERPGPIRAPLRKREKKLLPASFSPSPDTIICGRGKFASTAPGNRRLKMTVTQTLKQYKETRNRLDKSAIVSRVVNMTKEAAAPDVAFVQFEQGQWWQVNDGVAHEKVGRIFRDCLPTKYPNRLHRSSIKEIKLAGRRGRNAAKDFLNCSYDQSHTSFSSVTPQTPTPMIGMQHGSGCKGSMNKYADLLANYAKKRLDSATKFLGAKPLSAHHGDSANLVLGEDKLHIAFEQVSDRVGREDRANIFSFVNATNSTMEDCDIMGLEGSTADLPDDISGIFSADDREEDDLISKVVD
jgi:hypothetical protein